MFDCPHCGDTHHVNDFCATGPMSPQPATPMTHPLTPREKVALKPCPMCGMTDSTDNATQESGLRIQPFRSPAGGDACRVQCVCGASGPSSREDWQAAQKWNRRTALASGTGDQLSGNPGILKSGSGDHSGGVTDMIDHAELAKLAEAASGSDWQTYISGRPEYKNVTHYIEQNPPRDLPFIAEVQEERDAAFIAAANPATVLSLLAENAALRSANDVLEVERIGLRSAIFGSHDYDPALRHGNFIEMARATEDGRRGAIDRATEAERKLAEAVEALEEIAAIDSKPFEGGLDMEAIRACEECRRYEDHPVQHGICDTHRRPIWDREKHEGYEEKALGYRAKSIARTFLSKEAERG